MAKDPTGEGSTAKFEYDLDSIQKNKDDLSLYIEDPYRTPGRKTY